MPLEKNRSSRHPPKRKADSGSDNPDRKRAQNRISQQCLREKNLAYVRNLEDTVELLRSAAAGENDNSGGQQDRYQKLLEAHLNQMKENQALRDALLRLRKKLLSFSNAAAAAADDEIFSSILARGSEGAGDSPRGHLQGHPEPSSSQAQSRYQDAVEDQLISTDPSGITSAVQEFELQDTYLYEPPSVSTAVFEDAATALLDSHVVASHVDEDNSVQTTLFSRLENSSVDTMLALDMRMPSPTQTIIGGERVVITSGTVFGAKLLSACQKLIKRASPSLISTQELRNDFGKRLSLAACHLMSYCSGLESYIYGVNGAQYIEKVLSWRLGFEAKDGVPSPFRPTPLQSNDLVHSWYIDLFNWPDIRDQLLLQQCPLDYDMLTKDVMLHSVIDQPHRGVAVSVIDVFQNQILRRKATSTQNTPVRNYLNDPSWVLYEISSELRNRYPYEADLVERAFITELERRMQVLPPVCHSDQSFSLPTDGGFRPNDVATFLGLDNMTEWKLSKEFARKYPFLDCSAGTLFTSFQDDTNSPDVLPN
ncbi:unnamed protein product [Clonostachys rosea]|uniref:BZIP domain-containing protein n=1 Tax=Bionectria ochroleuca TaxID=29856 RepID=A0ABY6URV7_BIOOC|nr:unnamed protein product [Clonostachys rosea]